jgi:hypothetical protein
MKNSVELLTKAKLCELFDIDAERGLFIWKVNKGGKGKKGREAGALMSNGYVKIGIDNKEYLAHRLMWLYVYGEFPTENLDHIDRCRTNNCITNLRFAQTKQNAENMFRVNQNTSGYKGVHFMKRLASRKKPWQANITHNGKTIHIGYFESAEQACSARRLAENTYFTHHTS